MALISTITDDESAVSVDFNQFCKRLCSSCNIARRLQTPPPPDLDGVLNPQAWAVTYPKNQEDSVELSDAVALSPVCPVCSMIDSLLPAKGARGGMHIGLETLAATIRPSYHWSLSLKYNVLDITVENGLIDEPPLIHVKLVMSYQSLRQSVVVREIIPDEIDWKLVATWLDCCDTDHTAECQPSKDGSNTWVQAHRLLYNGDCPKSSQRLQIRRTLLRLGRAEEFRMREFEILSYRRR